jgi:hypothetical protein
VRFRRGSRMLSDVLLGDPDTPVGHGRGPRTPRHPTAPARPTPARHPTPTRAAHARPSPARPTPARHPTPTRAAPPRAAHTRPATPTPTAALAVPRRPSPSMPLPGRPFRRRCGRSPPQVSSARRAAIQRPKPPAVAGRAPSRRAPRAPKPPPNLRLATRAACCGLVAGAVAAGVLVLHRVMSGAAATDVVQEQRYYRTPPRPGGGAAGVLGAPATRRGNRRVGRSGRVPGHDPGWLASATR